MFNFIFEGKLGEIFSITSQTRESWNGILNAHPWLTGPEDTYLAWIEKGGGALYEHSHALKCARAYRCPELMCDYKRGYDKTN
jgi:hypothetical protein